MRPFGRTKPLNFLLPNDLHRCSRRRSLLKSLLLPSTSSTLYNSIQTQLNWRPSKPVLTDPTKLEKSLQPKVPLDKKPLRYRAPLKEDDLVLLQLQHPELRCGRLVPKMQALHGQLHRVLHLFSQQSRTQTTCRCVKSSLLLPNPHLASYPLALEHASLSHNV